MLSAGWLLIYHGVSELRCGQRPPRLCYSAGVMLLAKDQPQQIRYRSPTDIDPTLPQERSGTVAMCLSHWH